LGRRHPVHKWWRLQETASAGALAGWRGHGCRCGQFGGSAFAYGCLADGLATCRFACSLDSSPIAPGLPGTCAAHPQTRSDFGLRRSAGEGSLVGAGQTGLLKAMELANHYQSDPSTSPPAGVTAAHHVVPEMPADSARTLASARTTRIPPMCGVEAREASPFPGLGRT